LQQKQYHSSSSKQQHSEVPHCDQVLPKLLRLNLFLCLLIASHVFAREGEDVVVDCFRQEKNVAVDASFGESYHDDVLQFTKQLFYGRL
jgi:hypothetical protein